MIDLDPFERRLKKAGYIVCTFKPKKVAKGLGVRADRLLELRSKKTEINKALAALDEERKLIEASLIEDLPKSKAEGISGKLATVLIKSKKIPAAQDWPEIYKWIKRDAGRFAIMQRRLSGAAINEIWADGEEVPGVGTFTKLTVSCTTKK